MSRSSPDVSMSGNERVVVDVEETLGVNVIAALAQAARRHDVMISLTVTPFTESHDGEDDGALGT